jgi:Fe-S-cluster containining protein
MQRILKKHKDLLALVDAWFARSIELYPDKIACKSGCSACCRSLFDITLLDAYYLKLGFDALPQQIREKVLEKCRERLAAIVESWPEFDHPYVLNHRPDEDWQALTPEEDETPCVLLGDDGRCLLYDNRPMTCRLHGLPLLDASGELMQDDWCTMNLVDQDPLELPGLSAPFEAIFREEVAIFREFTGQLLNKQMGELDTFIPAALLIAFEGFDWQAWLESFPFYHDET